MTHDECTAANVMESESYSNAINARDAMFKIGNRVRILEPHPWAHATGYIVDKFSSPASNPKWNVWIVEHEHVPGRRFSVDERQMRRVVDDE